MTGGCLLVAFAPDGTTGNDDDKTECICILDFFPDLLFYTKIAFRFLEKEILGIVVLQSNGVTNIITVFKSYQHVSQTFLESN